MPSNRRNRGPSYRRRRKRKTTRRSRGRRMSTNPQPVSQIDIPDWITVSVKDIPRMTRRSYNVFLDWVGIEVRRWQAAHAAIWSNYIPTQPISTDNSPREYLSRWVNANTSICIRRNKSEERRGPLGGWEPRLHPRVEVDDDARLLAESFIERSALQATAGSLGSLLPGV